MSANPFATRFIRPGAMPFLFLDGDSAEAIVARLKANHWRGQIIGAHGSGKSTLVISLTPLIEAAGKNIITFKIGPGDGWLPHIESSSLSKATQLIIDGYEQLSTWSRLRLRWLVWRTGTGLLITTHTDIGLPTIYVTKPSEAVAAALAQRLTIGTGSLFSLADVTEAYQAAAGNVRETLFKLFDIYHQRQ